MISRTQLLVMAIIYTVLVAGAVAVTNVSGGVVFGVAVAWFSIGRAWDRLPISGGARSAPKWGRQ